MQEDGNLLFGMVIGDYTRERSLLNRRMVREAFRASKDVDLILLMTDEQGALESAEGDSYILRSLKPRKVPVFLLINKIDLIKKNALLVFIDT